MDGKRGVEFGWVRGGNVRRGSKDWQGSDLLIDMISNFAKNAFVRTLCRVVTNSIVDEMKRFRTF